MLKIYRTLLFRVVLISYAPHIVYETRAKMSLLNNIRSFNFRTDGSVRNKIEYEIKPNYGTCNTCRWAGLSTSRISDFPHNLKL